MFVTDLQDAGLLVPYGQMSRATVQETKYRLFDSLIALLGGAMSISNAELTRVRDVLSDPGTVRPLYPTDLRTSLESAAFFNAFLLRQADWGDTYWLDGVMKGHPADQVGAILAMADAPDVTGEQILELVHLSYQLWAACYEVMQNTHDSGWDYTSYFALTAPILAAVRFGDHLARINEAVRLSASCGMLMGQVRAGDVTNWKSGASGYAVARALRCYRLSKAFSAPTSTFDGPRGWSKLVAPIVGSLKGREADAPHVYANLDVKVYPCFQTGQSPVACARALYPRLEGRADRIQRISVTLSERHHTIATRPGRRVLPTSHSAADHNVDYLVAVVLLHGGLTPLHYEPRFLQSPDIRRLMQCVEIKSFPPGSEEDIAGDGEGCHLEVVLYDGTTIAHGVVRPEGAFVGLPTEERLARVQALVDRKGRMLEQGSGWDLHPMQAVLEHLEQHDGPTLVQAVHQVASASRAQSH